MCPYIHFSVIYNSQDLEAVQASISRRMAKTATVHSHNKILLGCKKENFYPL